MKLISTAAEAIDALGGTAAVARLTDVSLSSVSNWRRSNRISFATFLIFKKALAAKQLRAPASLWGIVDPDAHE